MKNAFFLILGLGIIFGSIFLFLKQPIHRGGEIKVVKINEVSIPVEVVRTPSARAQGLSGREVLPEGTGMLFVFETPSQYGFWMKDMNFPIDIVWISESFQVVDIEHRLAPETYPEVFYPSGLAKYVLELPAGASRNLGIDTGSIVYFGM
ncbi:MAG: DUF192 domain-containing protein [Minisyncoccia bacterium]